MSTGMGRSAAAVSAVGKPGERRAARLRVARLGAEERADLAVDRLAEPPLDRNRDERRKPVGGERHEIDDRQHQRDHRGDRPEDDPPCPQIIGMPAVPQVRAPPRELGEKHRVAELQPRQLRRTLRADAQHAWRRIGAGQIGVAPKSLRAVEAADGDAALLQLDADGAPERRGAVEIDCFAGEHRRCAQKPPISRASSSPSPRLPDCSAPVPRTVSSAPRLWTTADCTAATQTPRSRNSRRMMSRPSRKAI